MDAAEVAVRAVTCAAALLAFGASLFVLDARSGAAARADDDARRELDALRRAAWRLQLACAVTTIVAGLLCLVVHAATVAGVPLPEAASRAVAGRMLAATLYGRAMAWHLGLAAVFIVVLVVGRRAGANASSGMRSDLMRAALSGVMLAPFAWMGHAAATRGPDRYVHLGGDVAHLLAAGAWLGALPLLAWVLVRAARRQSSALDRIAIRTTRRFSAVGVACVGALLATGTINAWYLVATPAALFGTTYGRLLLLKLVLFAAMLALAARNRYLLMPRIREASHGNVEAGRDAMRDIARNAWIEAWLGIAIVVIVGALGLSVPGAHVERLGREHPPTLHMH